MSKFLEIDNILVEKDLSHIDFECKYSICKGDCCRGESDLGAPVFFDEIGDWTGNLSKNLYNLLPTDSIELIEKSEGLIKSNGKFYTEVKQGGDCVFLSFKHEFPACAFELLNSEDPIKHPFKKPLSCELFPLRIYEQQGKKTLEFKFYSECTSALSTKVNIVDFLKTPIVRAFGQDWYNKMKEEIIHDKTL